MLIWIVSGVVVLAIVGVVVAVVLKRKKKSPESVVNDSKTGFAHTENHFDQQAALIEEQIKIANENISKIEEQVSVVVGGRKQDHENIANAGGWDELNHLAEDIEGRR